MNENIESKAPVIPDGDEVKSSDEWDIDPSKACNLNDPECEACQ